MAHDIKSLTENYSNIEVFRKNDKNEFDWDCGVTANISTKRLRLAISKLKIAPGELSTHSKEKYFSVRQCQICSESSPDHRLFVDHMRRKHPETKFCNNCCKLRPSAEHAAKCYFANTQKSNPSVLEKDEIDLELYCKFCDRRHISAKERDDHSRRTHADFDREKAKFHCNECSYGLNTPYSYNRAVIRLKNFIIIIKLSICS